MEQKNERIVGVIKHLKGNQVDDYIRQEKGFNKSDKIKKVVKENSPRRIDYERSYGRFFDLVNSL